MAVAKLPKIEILFYGIIWIASFCYSSYRVYLAGKLFDHSVTGDDFSDSWHGYKKDMADYEWTTWLPIILYWLPPWIAIHIVLTEVTRWISPQGIPAVNCVVTISFLCTRFSPISALFVLVQVFVYYLILRLRSITSVWLFGFSFLIMSAFTIQEAWGNKDERLYAMTVISATWLYLRFVSFSIDQLASSQHASLGLWTFYDLLGYSFYLPTFLLGPFILYSNFGPYMYKRFDRWTFKRVATFLFNILRYLFWAAFTEASLYFLYIHALQYHISAVVQLGDWTLYGLGFLLGVFFCLKYIVVYGLAATVANFDGYIAPPPPKCVVHLHLYTDLWRLFDVGFYQFMHRYIYSPLCAGRRDLPRRLLASAVCFWFVFLWHGMIPSIFVWSLLNFIGVSIITLAVAISKTAKYNKWEKQTLSEANSRRLTALISALTFIMGTISQFYFFSGMEIGNIYVNQLLFNGTWKSLFTLWFITYCLCQVSTEIKIWEEARVRKLKSY